MKKRSGLTVMARLIRLVKPLSGYMVLAILMGLVGHLCAAFITIFGGFAVLDLLGFATPVALKTTFVCVLLFALVRGVFRYAEQSCNHFIAFKLLALIRDKVFRALRRLCPAKLEGRDRGDLISVITSDIELLEVFYAHTISPAAIAALFTLIMCLFIGHYHALLGLLALAAYVCVGVVIPLITSRRSGDTGMRFRTESGALSAFVLDSLRGLNETIQYDRGAERRAEIVPLRERQLLQPLRGGERLHRRIGKSASGRRAQRGEHRIAEHLRVLFLQSGREKPDGRIRARRRRAAYGLRVRQRSAPTLCACAVASSFTPQ